MPSYLGEIALDGIRGTIGIIPSLLHHLGFLLALFLGVWFDLSLASWLSMIPAICFLAIFIWMPETPYFLLRQNKPGEAFKSLKKLRGHSNIQKDLDKMTEYLNDTADKTITFTEIYQPENRRNLILGIMLGMSVQLSGGGVYLIYAETIFIKIGSDLIDPSYSSIIFLIVMSLSGLMAFFLIDIAGRRILLLTSVVMTTICNILMAIYFTLTRTYDLSSVSWLPITIMMILIAFYNFGLVIIPNIMLGELFPRHLKGIASILLNLTNAFSSLIGTKLYQWLSDEFGSDVSYWTFSVFCVFFSIYYWFVMPETKGKSLADIQREQKQQVRRKNESSENDIKSIS